MGREVLQQAEEGEARIEACGHAYSGVPLWIAPFDTLLRYAPQLSFDRLRTPLRMLTLFCGHSVPAEAAGEGRDVLHRLDGLRA
ncbi:MAG: hypothetical protein MUP64_16615, partial [Anaerolineae bacterium]|nr:hypothetical protein [Anaerolineae bacterium]